MRNICLMRNFGKFVAQRSNERERTWQLGAERGWSRRSRREKGKRREEWGREGEDEDI